MISPSSSAACPTALVPDVAFVGQLMASLSVPVFVLDTGRLHPWQGTKNERFRIRVTIPYQNVRWSTLGILNPTSVSVTIDWVMMLDDPFTVDGALPGWSP